MISKVFFDIKHHGICVVANNGCAELSAWKCRSQALKFDPGQALNDWMLTFYKSTKAKSTKQDCHTPTMFDHKIIPFSLTDLVSHWRIRPRMPAISHYIRTPNACCICEFMNYIQYTVIKCIYLIWFIDLITYVKVDNQEIAKEAMLIPMRK